MLKKEIIVKVITKSSHLNADKPSNPQHGSFPGSLPTWGGCRFVFGNEQKYDWLVVYDDFAGELPLNCPQAHTLLITSEPSSVKTYESAYTRQFAYVLTGQENWALKHPGKIHSQPALHWFYGVNSTKSRSYDQIAQNPPIDKQQLISTVTSSKRQKHTLHNKRYHFIAQLEKKFPELDRFGKGIREIQDKAEALDPYKYHIAIENHICNHWWTEKLSDAFLGMCLPFYCGAPNASKYFPEESFIPIDMNDLEGSYQIISDAIKNNEYQKRLPAIKEARKRVLEKYNLYSTISQIIKKRHLNSLESNRGKIEIKSIKCRGLLRRQPVYAILTTFEKLRNRVYNLIQQYIDRVRSL